MSQKEIKHNIEFLKLIAKKNLKVRQILNELTDELAKVSLTIDDLATDEVFQFSKYPEVTQVVTKLVNQYAQVLNKEITLGINQAFTLSYAASTDILGKLSIMSNDAVNRQRETAKNAFLKSRVQPEQGLSLSKLVWNYTNQHRAQFEMAMTDIIINGFDRSMSYQTLGRKVRGLLNRPDAMYRRYHEKVITKGGKKADKVYWRKRVVDENGKVHFVKSDLEYVGAGQYRSARANAERLTRTEINNAYRYADYERWNSEPFVIGFEIRLSGSHPQYDMCDELVGRYPKWFKFNGWHPQCLCIATAILIPEDEMRKISTLSRDQYLRYKSPHLITDMPQNYKDYIEKNAERLERSTEKGTQPWWVRDNYIDGDYRRGFVNDQVQPIPKAGRPPKTPEQIADIQKRWNERKEKNEIIERLLDPDVLYNDVVRELNGVTDFTGLSDNEILGRLDRILDITGVSFGGLTPSQYAAAHPHTSVSILLNASNKDIQAASVAYSKILSDIDKIGSNLLKHNSTPQKTRSYLHGFSIDYLKGIDGFISQFKSQIGIRDSHAVQTLQGIENILTLHNVGADLSKVSVYMPAELLPKGKWLGDSDHVFNKVFFDKLGRYVSLDIVNKNRHSYFEKSKGVTLDMSDERYASPLFRIRVVYHEYGHALFDEYLTNDKTIKAFRRKWNGVFTKGDNMGRNWRSLERDMWDEWLDAKRDLSTEEFIRFKDMFFGALDTGQAVSGGARMSQIDGHNRSYFEGSAHMRDTEIWAHICELNNSDISKYYIKLYGAEFEQELRDIYSVLFP